MHGLWALVMHACMHIQGEGAARHKKELQSNSSPCASTYSQVWFGSQLDAKLHVACHQPHKLHEVKDDCCEPGSDTVQVLYAVCSPSVPALMQAYVVDTAETSTKKIWLSRSFWDFLWPESVGKWDAAYLASPQNECNRKNSNGIGCHISDERSPYFGSLADQHDTAGHNTPHKHASPWTDTQTESTP